MRSAFSLMVVASLGVAVACSKSPPEPAPVASTRGAVTDIPVAAAKTSEPDRARCIAATPEAAPPAVPAGPAAGCPSDPLADGTLQTVLSITFPESKASTKVSAELARTPEETERGLMYRTKMAEDKGMLFRLEKHVEHTFWMRNTCIPLDMLFVEDDGLIVGIAENVPTLNDAARSVGCPSSWVLEVNAGWSRRHGVRAGQRLALPAAASQ